MKEKIERFNPDISKGLTDEQVEQRKKENLVNYDTSVPTKSIKRILFENFFTLFNFLNLFLAIAIFCVGSYKNMLFIFIVIINTAISTIQEIHSKKVVDKLSIMASSKSRVIRNGKKEEISVNDIVLDDILEFHTGNQIATDCIILGGTVQVNESFITGEPDSIEKNIGDMLLSGSYIVSGTCTAKVEHIAEDNFTAKISSGAKYVKKVKSEIMTSLQKIIRFLTFAIVPIGIALFYTQLQETTFQDAVVKTVAAIIGMIPEGLVLLTSTVLAVSVIRLSKSKVLVQELYCIETLARVDTLCLDKTGTLTEGCMEVKNIIPFNIEYSDMANILSNIAKFSDDENSTIQAIQNKFTNINNEFVPIQKVAFSSKTKWSGISFDKHGSYVLGAPEFVLKNNFKSHQKQIEDFAQDYRVLVLAHSDNDFKNNSLPNDLELIGYVLILDKIRKEAKNTLSYFDKQGVDIKIISGDNPVTVSKIAKQVEVKNWDKYIDMSTLKSDEEIFEKDLANKFTVFGRVSPTQKQALVKALQRSGKTVAMTGDGVNDVLALKASDCSIAMANGSDAAKNVSQLVLLDSNFASMPKVVAEGRRTINNLQRSASLFLVKTIYSTILALMFLLMSDVYPFIPIQLSLISVVTIGIPSFILALEPNNERVKGNFLRQVISKALPSGLCVAINIFILSMLNRNGIILDKDFSSLCVISTGMCGLILLFKLCKTRKGENTRLPFSIFRLTLGICLTFIFVFGLTSLNWLFSIVPLEPLILPIIFILVLSIVNFTVLSFVLRKLLKVEK